MRQAIQGMIFVDSSNLLITVPEESKVMITPTHIIKLISLHRIKSIHFMRCSISRVKFFFPRMSISPKRTDSICCIHVLLMPTMLLLCGH